MWELVLDFERAQHFWIGLLGFAGVILTLVVNGFAARRARSIEIRRARDALIRCASVELKFLKNVFNAWIESFDEFQSDDEGHEYLIPPIPKSIFIQSEPQALGSIEEEELLFLWKTFFSIKEMENRLDLAMSRDHQGGFRAFKRDRLPSLKKYLKQQVHQIEDTLSKIE